MTQKNYQLLLPFFIGIGLFFYVADVAILQPRNIAWLHSFDNLQHYLGWAFYRISPWTWPLGASTLYGNYMSSSVVFTDSLPIIALLFKPFSPWLSEPFQYFGFWYLACFVLQSYFGWKLSGLINPNIWLRCAITVLLASVPAFTWRVGLVASLSGQFLLLAAFYLNLSPFKKYRALCWTLLLVFALGINFYLLTMVYALWVGTLLDTYRTNRLTNPFTGLASKSKWQSLGLMILQLLIISCVILVVADALGYFMVKGVGGQHFGVWRMNVLGFFDSKGYSYLISPIQDDPAGLQIYEIDGRRYEGFNYLGLGIICLIPFALPICLLRWRALQSIVLKHPTTLLICILGLLFSFSNQIGIGMDHWDFPIAQPWFNFVSIWRASARMAWLFYYLCIIFLCWAIVTGYPKKVAIALLCMAAALQLADNSPGYLERARTLSSKQGATLETPLQDPFWDIAAEHYQKILRSDSRSIIYNPFAKLALKHHKATNAASFAREDNEKKLRESISVQEALRIGPLDKNALYILSPATAQGLGNAFDPRRDLLAKVDGYVVLAPFWKQYHECALPVTSTLSEIKPTPLALSLNQAIEFKEGGLGVYFLSYGWYLPESWGTWSDGKHAQVIFPSIPKGAKSLVFSVKAYLNAEIAEQEIKVSVNGKPPIAYNYWIGGPMVLKLDLDVTIHDATIQDQQPLVINFDFKNPANPKSIAGPWQDIRPISIGLVSARFIP